ncbi:flavodoxin domain-containing protein [Cellulomonas alba]|uniref:Flavodoxin domain-containing protein n=1 Tax=Cellulomonas alba TaxID=3053467 RepID=A0ABT7SBT8_9CELL|nr:flavodoxin domain-containing protein [Cellulomonas alba]MDM7853640.1 flavodoxin domain-containing protein [Cellulomonas alba]
MTVLVSVASRHGATAEMGDLVVEELAAAGLDVDRVAPDDVERVTGYDAVVLGSSVYVGRLDAGLRELVRRQAGQLRERPVWLFWSGPVGDPPVPHDVPDDVDAMSARIEPRDMRCFVGALDRGGLDLTERALVALTHAPSGDFRDLDEVREWARAIGAALTGTR